MLLFAKKLIYLFIFKIFSLKNVSNNWFEIINKKEYKFNKQRKNINLCGFQLLQLVKFLIVEYMIWGLTIIYAKNQFMSWSDNIKQLLESDTIA